MNIRIVGNINPGILDYNEAKQIASDMDLDLILVSDKSELSVYKIADLSKVEYEQKKKDKENKKKQATNIIKEVRITPSISIHDLETKIKQATEFYEKKFTIKASVFFKGREMNFKELGQEKLLTFVDKLSNIYRADSLPKFEGKRLIIILRPKIK